jgi:hypothetical protein
VSGGGDDDDDDDGLLPGFVCVFSATSPLCCDLLVLLFLL